MNTMWLPVSCSMISGHGFLGTGLGRRPAGAPAPNPSVVATPSWMRRSALDWARAWGIGVGDDEIVAFEPASIMLLTALPPAPPTPRTVMRGRSSLVSGT